MHVMLRIDEADRADWSFGHDLGGMRRDEELAAGEGPGERGDDSPLPPRGQVQLDLVDEDDASAEERIVGMSVRRAKAPRDIADHGEEALFAVGELVEVEQG